MDSVLRMQAMPSLSAVCVLLLPLLPEGCCQSAKRQSLQSGCSSSCCEMDRYFTTAAAAALAPCILRTRISCSVRVACALLF